MAITVSTMKSRKNFRPQNLVPCLSLLLLTGEAFAQGFDFGGTIKVGASKTDNIFLVPAPDETDETIFQVIPSLNLEYENQRVNAVIRYQFDWYKYAELDRTDEYHRYDVSLTGELVDETLFLEVGATRSQSVVDPDGVIPPGNLPISENLTDRDEYYVNPRFEKTFGRSVTATADYRYADVQYDDSDFVDEQFIQVNTNENASFELENYKRGQGLTWAASYNWEETEYEFSLPWEYRQARAELGFWASGTTRLFASGGKESAWDDPIDRSLQDTFWEAGFAYQNGDRMGAEFAAGERSFGSSWRGELDFSFQRGELSFSYAEVPTTVGWDRYSPGSFAEIEDEEPVDLLAQPGNAERYISKRGQASLNLNFRRTELGFVIFDEERIGRQRADGTPLEDETQSGASASFTWQAGARTEISARGSIYERDSEAAAETEYIGATMSANYRVGSSVFLTLSYDYSKQESVDPTTGLDYVARFVSFFVSYQF
jgi:hypothetical protein